MGSRKMCKYDDLLRLSLQLASKVETESGREIDQSVNANQPWPYSQRLISKPANGPLMF